MDAPPGSDAGGGGATAAPPPREDSAAAAEDSSSWSARWPIYQTSLAVHTAIAIVGFFVVFSGPRVGC